MVIHDLDDEFWGMTWKPPFEWRNTYHTRAEQDHTIHWFYGQNPQFKYRPSVKLLDIGTCNTLARTLGHCPRESKQVSQMSNDFFGRKTDMDSIYIYIHGFLWTYLDFTWIYLDFTWIYLDSTWILYGFYMDSLWIYMNLQMVFQKYLQLLLVDPGSPRRSEQFSASVVKNIHWTQTQPVSGVDCVHIYIYICMFIYK